MNLKRAYLVLWVTTSVLLTVIVDWRITVPLNQQGLIMVKDEANLWQRMLLSILVAGVFNGLNVWLLSLLSKVSKCGKPELNERGDATGRRVG